MNSNIYVQTHYFENCNIRNTPQYFINSAGLYDVTFLHNVIENGNTLVRNVDAAIGTNGLRIVDNVIEGIQTSTLQLTGCSGFVYALNHVESNAVDDLNFFAGALTNNDITIFGNYIYNPNGETCYYGPSNNVRSFGNTFGPNTLHANASQITNLLSDDTPLSGALRSDAALIRIVGNLYSNTAFRFCTPLGAAQSNVVTMGAGVPGGAAGSDGDYHHRTDGAGAAGTNIYRKIGGVWTGIA
jgi:hypothetical protein